MLSRTGTLNVEEVDVVSGSVDHGPESDRVRDLTVEPDVLVGGESPGETRADDANDVAQHGHEDKGAIEGEDETGATGRPYGPRQAVEHEELLVGFLKVRAT